MSMRSSTGASEFASLEEALGFRRLARRPGDLIAVQMPATPRWARPTILSFSRPVGCAASPFDLDKARSWYERAKEMGSPEGLRRLEVLANR
jgi:TPR repeat protein